MAFIRKKSQVYFIMMPVALERDIIARSIKQSSCSNRWVRMQTMILAVVSKTAMI